MPVLVTVATEVAELDQVPPAVVLLSDTEAPIHMELAPVMAAGDGETTTVVVTRQPEPSEYVITEVPLATPQTTPVVEPMTATAVLLLVHVPPDTASLRVLHAPVQTPVEPNIAVGVGLTVMVVVVKHPVANV
jgi:hypothetical protein